MNVDIYYFQGCPNHAPTVALVRDVIRQMGVRVVLREVEVFESQKGTHAWFLGSPTVLVDGRDIEPAARGRLGFSFGCRRYGDSGIPPRKLIEAALAPSV